MTQDDVLFGYRLQLFDLAGAYEGVARVPDLSGCIARPITAGSARSIATAWRCCSPRERRRPQMPNALPRMIEERILASRSRTRTRAAAGRVESWRGRNGAGCVVSPNGVWKVLRRHGLNTRAKRLGLIAGYRAPYEPPREPAPERHIDSARPGELVGIDCFYVGRLRGTSGAIWQLTAIDVYCSYAWTELVVAPEQQPDRGADQQARAPRRTRPPTAGWSLERVLSDNGNEFRSLAFPAA